VIRLFTYKNENDFCEDDLQKGIHIVILHASRVPPHIGMIIDNKYHSLNIKGQEINKPLDAFIKNIRIRKIPTLFIKIKTHNTFSNSYLKEHFITNIQEFPIVDIGVATCLSPIKLFFDEAYRVQTGDVNYIYELIPRLLAYELIEHVNSLFIEEEHYQFPIYTLEDIHQGITQAKDVLGL
jgi:hypothetical protein